MAPDMFRLAVSGRHWRVSYALPIFTFPMSSDSAPLLNSTALGSVGSPFIMTIWAPGTSLPMAVSSALPWSLPTSSPSKDT